MKTSEKLLYTANTLSQQAILIYILGNTTFIIFHTNTMKVDVQLGIFVLLNIFLLLFAFLMSVRQKVYDLSWGYAGVALAVFQFARVLWIPMEIVGSMRVLLITLLIVTSLAAFVGSIICIKRSQQRQNFIVENNVDLATLQK